MFFKQTKQEVLSRIDSFNDTTGDTLEFAKATRAQLFSKFDKLQKILGILIGIMLTNLIVLTIAVIVLM